MARLSRMVALLACLLLGGCGLGPQPEPVGVDIAVPTVPAVPLPAPTGPRTVVVYFVRDGRLESAERSTAGASIAAALELLAAGPTADELRSGLRTAVSAGPLAVAAVDAPTRTVVVDVSEDFIATSGTDQLLAVAQVVWTVTEAPHARRVRLTSSGSPIEVPTGDGLSAGPVSRRDYLLVAPRSDPVDARPSPRRAAPAMTGRHVLGRFGRRLPRAWLPA